MSPTLGCCDRNFWAWKFVDFPGARFQEAVCVLAFVYSNQFEDNRYFGNQRLLAWIGSALQYWSSIQYPDGSFDEAYPFERSLAATAFTTFYVGEALGFLGARLPEAVRVSTRQSMRLAGDWLIRNDETHGFLSNHLAAAAAACHQVYLQTGEDQYRQRGTAFIQKILEHQSSEGWYEEYGGADPGYQTHGSFYLARYWQLTRNAELLESLCRSMHFLTHFIHPDGSLGGEYASRNTQTYYPAAFEMLASECSSSAWIAETMRPHLQTGSAAGLQCIDAYNLFPFANNLVFAWLAAVADPRASVQPQEPNGRNGTVWFPEAGLVRVRHTKYDAYIGTAKGGVIKIFDRRSKRLVYNDCGYLGKLESGKFISSHFQDQHRPVTVEPSCIEIRGGFAAITKPVMNPYRFVAFRLFCLTVGRFPKLARWLKNYLVKVLIYRKELLDLEFQRRIEFAESRVIVNDLVRGAGNLQIRYLRWGEVFTTIHMGSSRYYVHNELNELSPEEPAPPVTLDLTEIGSGIGQQRTVSFE